jgi:thioredoxin-like negative regulator of GroEL
MFHSPRSGPCRRLEGQLAHTIQHRANHATFELVRVNVEERPDLAARFDVEVVPTLLVIDGSRVVRRLVSPRSVADLEHGLADWLR